MALLKLKDFDPNYREALGDDSIIGFSVYAAATDEKIGTVKDILVDENEGKFRYLVVDIGFWIFGKEVLLPIGLSRVSFTDQRIYARSLSKEQANSLPEFNDNLRLDHDYEEQVRNNYRTPVTYPLVNPSLPTAPLDPLAMGMAAPLGVPQEATPTDGIYSQPSATADARDSYNYQDEPSLYGLNDIDHPTIKLYEERLVANKHRVKTGEVEVGKHIETQTAQVSVPVEKERVVIERVAPDHSNTKAVTDGTAFQSGEVAHMEVYEETPDIRKETFVREEVRVRKEVDKDSVNAEETLRREELDLDTQGQSVDDRR